MINPQISPVQANLISTAYESSIYLDSFFRIALNYLCIVMGAFFTCIWIASRSNTIYLSAGLTFLLWSLLNGATLYPTLGLKFHLVYQFLGIACQACVFGLVIHLLLHRANWTMSLKTIAVFTSTFFACIALSLLTSNSLPIYYSLLSIVLIIAVYLYALHLLFITKKALSLTSDYLLALQSFLILCVVIHDYVVFSGLYKYYDGSVFDNTVLDLFFQPIYFTDISMLMLLVGVGALLVADYQQKTIEISYANDRLNSSMAKLRSELDTYYTEKSTAEASKKAQIERERIYQDLHDGLGSRLTRLLFRMSNKNVSIDSVIDEVSFSIDELRLIVNSETLSDPDFYATVFAYCFKLDEELQGRNIAVYYNIDEGYVKTPDTRVHVMLLRVLQEAVTNAVKHSNASTIKIACNSNSNSEYLYLSISDNGKGLADTYISSINDQKKGEAPSYSQIIFSRGLIGMRRRVFSIGGTIQFSNTYPGLCVEITCPLNTVI